jgi:hypothetical protein
MHVHAIWTCFCYLDMFPNGEAGYNLAKKNNALNARDLRPCFESLPQPVIGRIHGRLLP